VAVRKEYFQAFASQPLPARRNVNIPWSQNPDLRPKYAQTGAQWIGADSWLDWQG
jgi:hypothetical protein